ncbi:type II toxin-antitoxin system HicA family toxin [Candidatus Daviesbacteria bacterium]|nr:type II toxin-antitoxin system HicA family toxin [Candidatus Daviesbacteria bacterium]
MSKLPQIKARDLVKVTLKLGFQFRDQSGSHAVYIHSDGRRTTIPIHPSDTIGIGLLTKIIKRDLEITKDKFIKLLK